MKCQKSPCKKWDKIYNIKNEYHQDLVILGLNVIKKKKIKHKNQSTNLSKCVPFSILHRKRIITIRDPNHRFIFLTFTHLQFVIYLEKKNQRVTLTLNFIWEVKEYQFVIIKNWKIQLIGYFFSKKIVKKCLPFFF